MEGVGFAIILVLTFALGAWLIERPVRLFVAVTIIGVILWVIDHGGHLT